MTPFLDVPFLADHDYVDFLNDNNKAVDCVQISLPGEARLDNRVLVSRGDDPDSLLNTLTRLNGPRKYVLLNSRFYEPALFTEPEKLRTVIDFLEQCVDKGAVNGIIYCDHYLLQQMSNEAPDLASSLEAIPGINTMLDSFAKIEAQLSYINETRFQAPGKIVLDRSLNRDLDRLADTALKCRSSFPDIKLEVLANEGCMAYCPFKLSHDAYIALGNHQGRDCTYLLNKELGCMNLLSDQPYRIFQSPFIRPEDTELYFCHVDTIKLCGRTLGSDFLMRTITAYMNHRYDGNLLDLLDALQWLAPKLFIDNSALSFDFANMLSVCEKQCDSCGFCEELLDTISYPLPITIQDNRNKDTGRRVQETEN